MFERVVATMCQLKSLMCQMEWQTIRKRKRTDEAVAYLAQVRSCGKGCKSIRKPRLPLAAARRGLGALIGVTTTGLSFHKA